MSNPRPNYGEYTPKEKRGFDELSEYVAHDLQRFILAVYHQIGAAQLVTKIDALTVKKTVEIAFYERFYKYSDEDLLKKTRLTPERVEELRLDPLYPEIMRRIEEAIDKMLVPQTLKQHIEDTRLQHDTALEIEHMAKEALDPKVKKDALAMLAERMMPTKVRENLDKSQPTILIQNSQVALLLQAQKEILEFAKRGELVDVEHSVVQHHRELESTPEER